ncbi:DDT domain-containing protein DDR4 [Humulus lupulus]|uniref:DDT domain-containing protein DDR4 n=1 Tax=Humulus lupulus TaxID=3486 RepID=UPI002B409E5D|nr:DDT domain-containing protein DDR4 [Humulus lupulus]
MAICASAGGEDRRAKKENVVLDDEEEGEKCVPKPEVAELRGRWELASVLNFLTVFEPVIGKDLQISAEEIETGLICPDSSLAKLHIILLKGIPPVSKTLDGSDDAWVTVLCKKLSPWWPWVAEGDIPIVAAKGEEIPRYKGLDPIKRLLTLKALCEIRADQDDAVAYLNDALKQGTQISSFRKDKIGGDGKSTSFWYDGNKIVGYRLYREVTAFERKKRSIGRESSFPTCNQWETLATNLEEFRKVADEFSSSKVVALAAVGRTLKTDAIPVLEKIQKNKEQAIKRKQRKNMLLNDGRSFLASTGAGARVTRSCRTLRPVNYTFDDYDRMMKEAIQQTTKRTSPKERRKEREGSEIASESETDPEDPFPKRFCTKDDNVEDSNVDIAMLKDDGSDDDYSGKEDVDDSGCRDSATSEVSRKENRPFGARWSTRLAGGTAHPSMEHRNLGTKNISRQRPTHNSAMDSIVVPDSDYES